MKASFKQKSSPLQDEMDSALAGRVGPLFADALAARSFSGASCLVAGARNILFETACGAVGFTPGAAAITTNTWFDLASLSKPLVTASLCMVAVSQGWLDLDTPLEQLLAHRYVPADKARITLRQLLNHCSGLPAYRPFYRNLSDVALPMRRETLITWILQESLLSSPQTLSVYSDLGFMVVADILEHHLAMALDAAATMFLFQPLGIADLGFRSAALNESPPDPRGTASPSTPVRFAQTEWCPWRRRQLSGEVHDENASALGGVAGHAGLFGTARGMYRWLSFLWDVHEGRATSPWLTAPVVRSFWQRQELVAGSTWALGFDTPSAADSSAGDHFSPHTVGHLGFTGTSFWLDLDQEIMIILLTNRVHQGRNGIAIKAFRPQLHNAVMETLYAR